MSMAAYYLDPKNRIYPDIDADSIRRVLVTGNGLLWVNFANPDEAERLLLLDEFQFHPLVVDTAVSSEPSSARVEDFGGYIFVNARSIDYTSDTDIVETATLGMFIGPNYVVTVHNVEMPSVEAIKQLVEVDGRPMMKGPGFFAHAHFDALIQAMLPTLDRMADRADAIEELILENPDHSALVALTMLKRSCLSLNRALGPQREVLSRLGRREFDLLGGGVDIYFRDLMDDLIRIQSANDAIRERADTSLATYLSVISNRQNEIMKILSIVATVFLPLGLIAGLFGMNFQNMPGLEFKWGYHIIWAATILALGLISWMFWLKRWIVTGAGIFRPRRLRRFVPSAVDPIRLAGFLGRTVTLNLRLTANAETPERQPRPTRRPTMLQRLSAITRRPNRNRNND